MNVDPSCTQSTRRVFQGLILNKILNTGYFLAPYEYPLGKNTPSLYHTKSVKQMGIAQLTLFNLIFIDLPSLDFAKFIIYQEGTALRRMWTITNLICQ